MPEVTAHAPGTSSWVELATPDVAASREFYHGVFGWYSYTLTMGVLGEYEIFTLGGVQGPEVAGAIPLADDAESASWTCYFRTDDVAATLDAVRAGGGWVTVEPIDVADLGRMAQCSDPQGADFALWLPYNLQGAGVVDEPDTLCWVELASLDLPEAREFYGAVFGWTPIERSFYSPSYTEWKAGDWSTAGLVSAKVRPTGLPSQWMPFFWVADCDAAALRAAELGARVDIPPVDVELGRFSVLTDPLGAHLAVTTPNVTDRTVARVRP
jgi:predicted enzyme related to lactoylglutathione lyase